MIHRRIAGSLAAAIALAMLPVASYIWTFFDPCIDVSCAREIINRHFIEGITYVSVRVDGERIENMPAHLVRVAETNPLVFSVDARPIQSDGYGGILNAAQGGYWVMLAPLRPGLAERFVRRRRGDEAFQIVDAALKPVLAEAGQGAGSSFERDAAVVLRRLGEAVGEIRALEPDNRRAFLDLLGRVIAKAPNPV